ncbi:MAG: hypothetical protein J3Q66DRAFT_416577 [Benniella sp.]|nr:MAG: hypothetical protein J3Q66DRAFT_416577 [Benniella sp.]
MGPEYHHAGAKIHQPNTLSSSYQIRLRSYSPWTGARGAISIWDLQTGQLFSHVFAKGIKLGVFKKGPGNNRYFEKVFGKNHFMAYNPQAVTISKPMKQHMRGLVRLRDMAIVKTIPTHDDYRFNYPQTGGDPVFHFVMYLSEGVQTLGRAYA